MSRIHEVYDLQGGTIRFLYHAGQWKAHNSRARTTLVLAGTQGGKTVYGPWWLMREMAWFGPGDYLVAAPTYPLLALKALPSFLTLFQDVLKLGTYVGAPIKQFVFSDEGKRRFFEELNPKWIKKARTTNMRVVFGHAGDPDSLESMTAKGAWLDEAGQKRFKEGSYEAIQRRLAINQGRQLITTTPYYMGWLKEKVYDRRHGPGVEVVNFRSIDNPAFPRSEFEAQRRLLPEWRFRMMFEGLFTRPAGLIYEDFDEEKDIVEPFPIPKHWTRYWGADFGGVNTCFVMYAYDPEKKLYFVYDTYHAGNKTISQHIAELKKKPHGLPHHCYGGAPSEKQWRKEFRTNGLTIQRPKISDVELGITAVIGAHREHKIKVFRTCREYIEEKRKYSRVIDDLGNVTDEIEDKSEYHHMDAERYILSLLFKRRAPTTSSAPI